MTSKQATDIAFMEAPPQVSEWRRLRRVFFGRWSVIAGASILALVLLVAILAPLLAPHDPYQVGATVPLSPPNPKHPLGSDTLGRDTLSRLIYGSRTALMVGFITVAVASFVGVVMGVVAGYSGGVPYMLTMRIVDTLMCFPMLLLALVIAAVLGGGIHNVIIALSVALIPGYARVTCAMTLSVRENDYVTASQLMGASDSHIVFQHILPNILQPILVLMTMQLGSVILAEASLSFLGIGIEPPGAAWGAMVYDGYRYLVHNPVLSFAPGLAIMLTVFAFNMVGDGLRDALDPRLRGLL
ncbi:MAG TPA: ABC transporter permease [Firmicutes bacterium]|nr:ABC transporter permease [Bacillota bacterium]